MNIASTDIVQQLILHSLDIYRKDKLLGGGFESRVLRYSYSYSSSVLYIRTIFLTLISSITLVSPHLYIFVLDEMHTEIPLTPSPITQSITYEDDLESLLLEALNIYLKDSSPLDILIIGVNKSLAYLIEGLRDSPYLEVIPKDPMVYYLQSFFPSLGVSYYCFEFKDISSLGVIYESN